MSVPVRASVARVTVLGLLLALLPLLVPSTAGAAAPPPRWDTRVLQMGDSYSAGNGAGQYTETTCYRSPLNYGRRVATALRAQYSNVACSGGVIADLTTPRPLGAPTSRTKTYRVPAGAEPRAAWTRAAKKDRLCGEPAQPDWYHDYRVGAVARVGSLVTATVSCQLTARAQVEAVTPATDVVLLTIGGNDLGFSSIVVQCLVLRSATGCEGQLDASRAGLPSQRTEARQVLREIERRSRGRAEVYLLSYPYLLDRSSYGLPEIAPTYDAGAALEDLQDEGDRVQQQVVDDANAATGSRRYHFVGTVKDAWGGHEHGLDPRSTRPDNSDAWLVPVGAPGRAIPEWVHPTPEGWRASADAVLAEIRRVGATPVRRER